MRRLFVAVMALGLVACKGDADGDGLTNKEEKDLGLDPDDADSDGDGLDDGAEGDVGADPLVADTDGDGLSDGEEVAAGADPTLEDTDGDGYLDFDEVAEGHDPADPKDRIYRGNWPYNRDKDAMRKGQFDGSPLQVGDLFPRYKTGVDQFGQTVDLYDFAGAGDFVVVDASATWCGPCQATAMWVSGVGDPYDFDRTYGDVKRAVDSGRIRWITVLTDGDRGPATEDEIVAWDEEFPHESIPVLTDTDENVLLGINLEGSFVIWPSFVLLDGKKMEILAKDNSGQVTPFLADVLREL